MNFFGIGTLELLVIFLVAFVALGPGKTVEVARTIGRMAREARRTFTDIMDAANPVDPTPNRRDPESPPRNRNTVPPDDPISSPPHLAEQTQTPSEVSDPSTSSTRHPPDAR